MTTDERIDLLMGKIDNAESDIEILQLLHDNCHEIIVVANSLDEHLCPIFELLDKDCCPYKMDGICSKCGKLVCVNAPNGVFKMGAYDGYCIKE